MLKIRTFKDFVGENGENEVLVWLNMLPKVDKARINTIISRLEVMEALEMPATRMLKGPCHGLMELRIPTPKIEYRPLCCYGPGRKEITILVGAVEKGDRFVPQSACSTALRRKARIGERGRTCDHDFR